MVQFAALVADHEILKDCPAATEVGLKVIATAGGGGGCTMSVTLAVAEYGPVLSVG
jgi:hypothetical protein